MKGSNSTNAFVQLQAPSGSIADVINHQENIEFKYRAEKREEDNIKYERGKDEQLWRDKFFKDNLKDQDIIDTGNTELNFHASNVVTKAMDEAGVIANQMALLHKQGKGTSLEYNKLNTKLHTLNNTSDVLKQAVSPMSTLISDINAGKYHKDEALISTLKNLQDAEVSFDEKGKLNLNISNSDGTVKKVSYNDMLKGAEAFGLIPKVDLEKVVSAAAKEIDTHTEKYSKGNHDYTKTGIPLEVARNTAQSLLFGSPGGTMLTATSKSWLKENGYDPNNPDLDALKKLENTITERILNSKKSSNEESYDRSAANAQANLALSERKFAHEKNQDAINNSFKREELNAKKIEGANGAFLTKADSEAFAKNKDIISGSKSITTNSPISLGTLTAGGKNYNDVKVNSITYNKNGKAVLEVDYKTDGTEEDKDGKLIPEGGVKTTITVNSQNEERVARSLGMTSAQMREVIEVKPTSKEDLRSKYKY